MITLVALTLLSFSLHALISANNAQQVGYRKALFLSDSADISHTMKEVCVLGDGNSRKIHLKSEIEINGKTNWVEIREVGGNGTHTEELPCKLITSGKFSGMVYIKNEKGQIRVEQ